MMNKKLGAVRKAIEIDKLINRNGNFPTDEDYKLIIGKAIIDQFENAVTAWVKPDDEEVVLDTAGTLFGLKYEIDYKDIYRVSVMKDVTQELLLQSTEAGL